MLCRIGDIEVWRILEMVGPFRSPSDLFPNAGPEVASLIEKIDPGSICTQTGRLILPVQGFLLRTPSHMVLVDTCIGNHKTVPNIPSWHKRNSDRFLMSLRSAGASPEDIDFVMCTHLHTDHFGWNTQLLDGRWVPTFPNARYLFPASDMIQMAPLMETQFTESVSPVVKAGLSENVSPDFQIGREITLMATPGHTPGHVSVLLESCGAKAVITGDALHSIAQCTFPDWHFTYDFDAVEAVQSRYRLLEHASDSNSRVLGSHFSLPSLGKVTRQKKGFCWCSD